MRKFRKTIGFNKTKRAKKISNCSNMTKLVELIAIAENIPYTAPTNPNIDEWTSDELLYESIHIALVNRVQIRSALHICETFPPLKLIYKSILSRYIKYYTDMCNSPQQSHQSQYTQSNFAHY